MLKSPRTRIVALIVAIAVVLTGVLVPIAASALTTYPTTSPGSVQVVPAGAGYTFSTSRFPSTLTSPSVQWFRGAAAIPVAQGGTGSTYTPTLLDQDQQLKVAYTFTVPGYSPTTRVSAAYDFNIKPTGTAKIVGTATVTQNVSVLDNITYTTPPGAPSPTVTYQWYRNGAVIGGASGLTYQVTAADFGAKLTVRVSASSFGAIPRFFTTPPVTITGKGLIGGSPIALIDVDAPGDGSLTLTGDVDSVTEPGLTTTFQWYRVNRTTGALTVAPPTGAVHVPVAADAPFKLMVRATFSKAGYANRTVDSPAKDFTVRMTDSSLPATVWKDLVLTAAGTFSVESYYSPARDNVSGIVSTPVYKWYRSGVQIAGAAGPSYTVKQADIGKTISYSVSTTLPGYLPDVDERSASTGVVLAAQPQPFTTLNAGQITNDGVGKIRVDIVPGAPAPTSYRYQWTRGGMNIPGQTQSKYTLVAADADQDISVKVTAVRAGFISTLLPDTTGVDHGGINPTTAPVLSATTPNVGETLSVTTPGYTTFRFGGVSANVAYQWLRAGLPIAAPLGTASTYKLGAADLGKVITLRITATTSGYLPNVINLATSPVAPASLATSGTPEIRVSRTLDSAGFYLSAITVGITEPSATVTTKLQWYRVNRATAAETAIPGATGGNYRPVAADYPFKLRVRANWSKPGFTTLSAASLTKDWSLRLAPLTLPAPGAAFGTTITPVAPEYTFEVGSFDSNAVFTATTLDSSSIQWYRGVAPISGGTADSYTPAAIADIGQKLSYRRSATLTGWLPVLGQSSPSTTAVVPGTQPQNAASVNILLSGSSLTAQPGVNDVPGSDPYTVQWYRNGSLLTGKTALGLTLPSFDPGASYQAKLSYKRNGYATVVLSTNSVIPSVVATPAVPVITGTPAVGQVLAVATRTYKDGFYNASIPVTPTNEWLANGVVVGTGTTFTPTAAEKGKTIAVRVTGFYVGLYTSVSTSLPTLPVGNQVLTGAANAVTVTIDPSSTDFTTKLKAVPGVNGPTGVVYAYQWLRAGAAIPGPLGTAPTYTLAAADRGKAISVRVTASHLPLMGQSFTTVVTTSAARDYTVTTGVTPNVTSSGAFRVGTTVDLFSGQVSAEGMPVDFGDVRTSVQWYRQVGKAAPVLIGGETSTSYFLRAADVNAKIIARYAITKTGGYLAQTGSTAPTPAVTLGQLTLNGAYPVVQADGVNKVKAVLAGGAVVPTPTKYAYQWLRNNVAIPGQIAASYSFVAADRGQALSVRVTPVLAGFAATPLPVANAYDYGLYPTDPFEITPSAPRVGETVSVNDSAYASDLPAMVTRTYQWLRGAAVVATGPSYTLVAADLGLKLSARTIATSPGAITQVNTVTMPTAVAKGHTTTAPDLTVTYDSASQKLTAALGAMVPATPAPVGVTYAWFRKDPVTDVALIIPGQATASYKPTAADNGQSLFATAVVNRGPAFDNVIPTVFSNEINPGLNRGPGPGQAPVVLQGTLNVGKTVSVQSSGGYFDFLGNPVPLTETVRWFRSGVVAPVGTNSTYTLQAADLGKTVTAEVTAAVPGYLTYVAKSAASAVVDLGTIEGNFGVFATVTATANATGGPTLRATVSSATLAAPETFTFSYRWYRNGSPITPATLSSSRDYRLVEADNDQDVRVFISASKPGYATLSSTPADPTILGIGNWLVPAGVPTINTTTLHPGVPVFAIPPAFSAPGSPTYTVSYIWYRDGVMIDNAESQQYTLTNDDIGHHISVRAGAVAHFYDRVNTGFSDETGVVTP